MSICVCSGNDRLFYVGTVASFYCPEAIRALIDKGASSFFLMSATIGFTQQVRCINKNSSFGV